MTTIKKISNLTKGVFKNFDWDSLLNGKKFEKLNIIYGRNYSGKTTLSRLFRAIETGQLSKHYLNSTFSILLEDNSTITETNLMDKNVKIRVFNQDFVKENLSFITHGEAGSIQSFAILGERNQELQQQIEELTEQLGTEEKEGSLIYKVAAETKKLELLKLSHEQKNDVLEDKLSEEAYRIKHNLSIIHYIKPKLKDDISKIQSNVEAYNLSVEQEDVYKAGASENSLPDIITDEGKEDEINEAHDLESLFQNVKSLIEKDISVSSSDTIQELVNDTVLNNWVQAGRKLHTHNTTHCSFCNNLLPHDLLDKLDKHFNQETKDLEKKIDELITTIETAKNTLSIPDALSDKTMFYTKFHTQVETLKREWEGKNKSVTESLNSLIQQLNSRKTSIFKPLTFSPPQNDYSSLQNFKTRYQALIGESKRHTQELSKNKEKAQEALRLNQVVKFYTISQYKSLNADIANFTKQINDQKSVVEKLQEEQKKKKQELTVLQDQLRDEKKGADRVNELLKKSLTSHEWRLVPKPKEDNKNYRFEIRRLDYDTVAHNLSEGEQSLIAFCYFIAKLEEATDETEHPILWIDDPICSLDSNHIFYIYELIANLLGKGIYPQVFISTHNLEFLKYTKRLKIKKADRKDGEKSHFLVERTATGSCLRQLPKYLKHYATEFNYLFEQIYKCATELSLEDDELNSIAACFGNNARKFLELFLYYKYPSCTKGDQKEEDQKFSNFFGDEAVRIQRVINEASHAAGTLERSSEPISLTDKQHVAQIILQKLAKNDSEQFKNLLDSIEKGCPSFIQLEETTSQENRASSTPNSFTAQDCLVQTV